MKKTIKISISIVCVLMLALSMVSCASMAKFENNLGDDYKIEHYNNNEIKSFATAFALNPDDYGVEAMFEGTNKTTGCGIMIIQCASPAAAKQLVADSDDIVEILAYLYPSK